ncbi:MAG: FGGY-family carbohydrate kinase [Azospirillaceae bacterium]|nr:FGGY-family carbohydrate kinase [Azospirillaceae bacterium]
MANRDCLLGVDIGTSSVKAVVVDCTGQILANGRFEYGFVSQGPLWAEQSSEAWFRGFVEAVRIAIARAGISPDRVAAMAVSSIGGGSGIPVDAGMQSIRPCLLWLDRRAKEESEQVRRTIPESELYAITGNGADSYFGFTKILWIKRHEPEVWSRINYFLPPNADIIYRLTGEIAVDYSSACNFGGIFDIAKRTWSKPLLHALGIPDYFFPERLVASDEVVGTLHRNGAQQLGLIEGMPVCAGGVDAAVATLRAGVLREGQHAAMLSSSMCWGFVHAGPPRFPALVSMPYVLDSQTLIYSYGGAATAGSVVHWFRDNFGDSERLVEDLTVGGRQISAYDLLADGASAVPAGSDGVMVLPYFMGERSPIWDVNARGTITGLTLRHTKAHLYRAMLEGVAYALQNNIECGNAVFQGLEDPLTVVGDVSKSDLWMEIIANVTGRPLRVLRGGGKAAYGDAVLAAYGIGMLDREGLSNWLIHKQDAIFHQPNADAHQTYRRCFDQYKLLYQHMKGYFLAISQC